MGAAGARGAGGADAGGGVVGAPRARAVRGGWWLQPLLRRSSVCGARSGDGVCGGERANPQGQAPSPSPCTAQRLGGVGHLRARCGKGIFLPPRPVKGRGCVLPACPHSACVCGPAGSRVVSAFAIIDLNGAG